MSDIFRTDETKKKYEQHRHSEEFKNSCALCSRPELISFKYWKIMSNDFPYDKISAAHDMIMPKRHVTEAELTPEEMEEYKHLKASELQAYDYIFEPTIKKKSIPGHFHLHLIVGK